MSTFAFKVYNLLDIHYFKNAALGWIILTVTFFVSFEGFPSLMSDSCERLHIHLHTTKEATLSVMLKLKKIFLDLLIDQKTRVIRLKISSLFLR